MGGNSVRNKIKTHNKYKLTLFNLIEYYGFYMHYFENLVVFTIQLVLVDIDQNLLLLLLFD